MAKRRMKLVTAICLGSLLLGLSIWGIGELLLPVRAEYGCTWHMYRNEPEDRIDLLFLGSSITYCDVIPPLLWEESGIKSYVMAGPEQTLRQTYYVLQEACKTQSPQAVALEVSGLFFAETTNYTKANIGYLPWGKNRLLATFRSAPANEIPGLLFPILNYHSQLYAALDRGWLREYYRQKTDRTTDPLAGYTLLTDQVPQEATTVRETSTDTEAYRHALQALGDIADYCADNQISLILFFSPTCSRVSEENTATMLHDLENIPHALFLNGNNLDPAQYDADTDWYDSLHLNVYGAEKFTRTLALQLTASDLLTPTRDDTALWQEKLDGYRARLSSIPSANSP